MAKKKTKARTLSTSKSQEGFKEGFSKVLIANRGEIACRVISACKSLGLRTVAVYSEADSEARHVALADQAVCIGPGPAQDSYLKVDAILNVAEKMGAQAIHPGYGFLSERAHFAKAVLDAGLVWIGPAPKVIDLMGNKIAAKLEAEKANVPTLAWALLKDGWAEKELKLAAKKVGFPLLLKAAAGGGGRGMRLVEKESELFEKAQSAMREAQGAFGSGELFLEKYCGKARHIEVQVFGDHYGNVTSFGERECSAQRRHQKVIEEAPAPNLSQKTREALWTAAEGLARSVGYANAGTCEFLVDSKENFYFLEMNTRLQVEHPVTELVWGVDLVALQLRVERGEKIPKWFLADKAPPRGHAVELRVYAEDPANQFMPSPGKITEFSIPSLAGLRLDSGYEEGGEVPIFYDAMLGKLIAWGNDREQARKLLMAALERTTISGVKWNGDYLFDVLSHERFIEGKIDTQFLGEEFKSWKPKSRTTVSKKKTENPSMNKNSKEKDTRKISPWIYFGSKSQPKLSGVTTSASSHHTDEAASAEVGGPLVAQYPGKILKVLTRPGQKVTQGQVVIVCESMKMEFSYSAPFATKVKAIHVKEGQVIPASTLLIEWEEAMA